jgi:3-oxoacyl-[acyl-carrier protein] reductase
VRVSVNYDRQRRFDMSSHNPPVLDFTGKTVLVTGAASGFGEEIARSFASAGARLVVVDRDGPGAERVAGDLRDAVAITTDLTDETQIQAMARVVQKNFGGLDVLVNNAGLPHRLGPFEQMKLEDIDFQWAVNLRNVVLTSQACLPLLKRNVGSSIVNVASIGAVRPRPGMLMYSAMKGGIIVFTRGLATEVAPAVRVNCVTPVASETGFVKNSLGSDTFTDDMRAAILKDIPMGRTSRPTDVADAILFLASDRAQFLTGVVLDVDGGRSI